MQLTKGEKYQQQPDPAAGRTAITDRAQYASFAKVSNAAYERRQAKKARMQSGKDTYPDTMIAQDSHLQANHQAHLGIQESIFMRLARWLFSY